MEVRLSVSRAVVTARPMTSPMAHPVRQWTVASKASLPGGTPARTRVLFAPARRRRRSHFGRPRRGVAVDRDLLGRVPRARGRELFLPDDRRADAAVGRDLEVRRLPEGLVRADLDTVAAENASVDVELVRLEVALAHHERPGRAGLGARAAGDAVGVVERRVPRRRDDGVVADAHEAVAVRADDVFADAHALRAVDALVEVAKDERVREVVLVVVVVGRLAAVEAVRGEAVLDGLALQVAAAHVRAHALEAPRRLLRGLLARIALFDELEGELAVLVRQERHAHLRLLRLV